VNGGPPDRAAGPGAQILSPYLFVRRRTHAILGCGAVRVITMKWKLHTRDGTRSPPVEGSNQYDSKDVALRVACGIFRHQPSVAVLYIEGPNGERIEPKDIAAWCKILARP
jgi:hypothetical protein